MSVNINPVHPVATTNLADSSGSEQPVNAELMRKMQAMNDELKSISQELAKAIQESTENTQQIAKNTQQIAKNGQQLAENSQQLAENSQQLAENSQTLDNLEENLEQIEEGIQELQDYQQTAVNKIFVFVIQGFQRVQEMGSSMIRIPGYPNVPMLQGTSQPIESQRDPDSASSPSTPAQPAEKKSLCSTFSLGSMLQFGHFLGGYGRYGQVAVLTRQNGEQERRIIVQDNRNIERDKLIQGIAARAEKISAILIASNKNSQRRCRIICILTGALGGGAAGAMLAPVAVAVEVAVAIGTLGAAGGNEISPAVHRFTHQEEYRQIEELNQEEYERLKELNQNQGPAAAASLICNKQDLIGHFSKAHRSVSG